MTHEDSFSERHIVPDGHGMLACRCLVPDGWLEPPFPVEEYDFSNATVFLPLYMCMAPYGTVVFTIAARPAFDDGSVQDWAEFLASQNNLVIERAREARIDRVPCVLCDATMDSEVGPMRSRSVFLEDGGRLYNVGTLAPEAIWPSVEGTLHRLLASFRLDDVQGLTRPPLREMTSEAAVDLSALATEAPSSSKRANSASTSTPVPDSEDVDATADLILASLQGPAPEDREFAGQPIWWRDAVLLERKDRIADAEAIIEKALDHIGVYSQLARLHEDRCARLEQAGNRDGAREAKERAIHWLYMYAGSATSGGEGAALSLERDQRIAALGGEQTVA